MNDPLKALVEKKVKFTLVNFSDVIRLQQISRYTIKKGDDPKKWSDEQLQDYTIRSISFISGFNDSLKTKIKELLNNSKLDNKFKEDILYYIEQSSDMILAQQEYILNMEKDDIISFNINFNRLFNIIIFCLKFNSIYEDNGFTKNFDKIDDILDSFAISGPERIEIYKQIYAYNYEVYSKLNQSKTISQKKSKPANNTEVIEDTEENEDELERLPENFDVTEEYLNEIREHITWLNDPNFNKQRMLLKQYGNIQNISELLNFFSTKKYYRFLFENDYAEILTNILIFATEQEIKEKLLKTFDDIELSENTQVMVLKKNATLLYSVKGIPNCNESFFAGGLNNLYDICNFLRNENYDNESIKKLIIRFPSLFINDNNLSNSFKNRYYILKQYGVNFNENSCFSAILKYYIVTDTLDVIIENDPLLTKNVNSFYSYLLQKPSIAGINIPYNFYVIKDLNYIGGLDSCFKKFGDGVRLKRDSKLSESVEITFSRYGAINISDINFSQPNSIAAIEERLNGKKRASHVNIQKVTNNEYIQMLDEKYLDQEVYEKYHNKLAYNINGIRISRYKVLKLLGLALSLKLEINDELIFYCLIKNSMINKDEVNSIISTLGLNLTINKGVSEKHG